MHYFWANTVIIFVVFFEGTQRAISILRSISHSVQDEEQTQRDSKKCHEPYIFINFSGITHMRI